MNPADPLGLPWLEDDLARLEVTLHRSVAAEDPFLTEVATHLIAGGGKRLRPVLTLASAAAGSGAASEEVLLGGVAVELVHLASLYHDDVMDEATDRRNVQSVNARWGNLVAVVAGDFVLARAAGIAASLGTEVAGLLAATLARMCEGQVREVETTFDVARSEASYLAAIAGKTAALTSTACRVGALTAGLDRRQVEAVTAFGERLGMVFQIRDDILDVVASDDELGKPPGQDLMKGVYTLPVLRALADPDGGPELASLLGGPIDGPELERARSIVAGGGAIAAAAGEARRWAERAAETAAALGPGMAGEALRSLAYGLLDAVPVPSA
ncbi:MAG: polyprenyl synthetase family protein [Acidimicrobiales bacterium]